MRAVILIAVSLLATANAGILNMIKLSDETIEYMGKNSNAAVSSAVCISKNHRKCQADLNTAIGIADTLDWKNADQIAAKFEAYGEANVTEMLTLCAYRAKFYRCLGTQYSSCVSLYNILGQQGTSTQNAYTYVDMYTALDFICNAGFEETVNQYSCLQTIALTTPYKTCIDTFKSNITGHPEILCDSAYKAGLCLNDVYSNGCQHDKKGAGWFGCQSFIGSFDEACFPKNRCYVH